MSKHQNLIEKFNLRFPVGSLCYMRTMNHPKVEYVPRRVTRAACDLNGQPVAFFEGKSGCVSILPDFIDYSRKVETPADKPSETLSKENFLDILSQVRFADYEFCVKTFEEKLYLQAEFNEPDALTGKIRLQKTRKWLLSPFMTRSEVVQTALKCVLTSVEHEAREKFTYKNERIFSPHFDVEKLVELCQAKGFDERLDWYAETD